MGNTLRLKEILQRVPSQFMGVFEGLNQSLRLQRGKPLFFERSSD
jgi:hypothetical protein